MDSAIYIYDIISPKGYCYSGQSNRGEGDYKRLEYHIKAGWGYKHKTDNTGLKSIFRNNNLKDIAFNLYDISNNFGISKKKYNDFLEIFSPFPDSKVEYDDLDLNLKIDLAEIFHIAILKLKGFRSFNKSMGGQHYQWYFANSKEFAFNRSFSADDFLSFMSSYGKLRKMIESVAIQQYQIELSKHKDKLKQIIADHWERKKKQKTLNWKEFLNMLQKHDGNFYQIFKQSIDDYLNKIQNTIAKITNFNLDIKTNFNETAFKQISRIVASVLSDSVKKGSIQKKIQIPIENFIFMSIDFKKAKWKKKNIKILNNFSVKPSEPEVLTPFLKKWTTDLFAYLYEQTYNTDYYQQLYNKHDQHITFIETEYQKYALVKRIYKNNRDLNFQMLQAYLKNKIRNMPFLFNNWNMFYNEQINYYFNHRKKHPIYLGFTNSNDIFAYRPNTPKIIDKNDDTHQIILNVNAWGEWSVPFDYNDITIY